MAVVTSKSLMMTNRDASPSILSNANIANSKDQVAIGYVAATSGDSVGSKYLFCQVPSNARISKIFLYSDDLGTTTVSDFGLYQTTANGGAAVSAAFFASAVVLNAGPLNAVDITHESGTFSLANSEKALWSALGLASDPGVMYDIVGTLTGACDGTGAIVLKVDYAL